ncbi:MAG TPA: replication initiator protein A [Gemmatimonadaceae bacterium]|nr:replication initiator protein A [Gemmatimonadaceae bacterium]
MTDPSRRTAVRGVVLDRSLEQMPVFRLSDSADDGAITFVPDDGGRWRVLPAPGERLPGTFDQDVYIELLRRLHEAGNPADGTITFTLHAFLRSMGRRVDGRTYEQLRSALNRLLRTTLESDRAYHDATSGSRLSGRFSILSAVQIDRRRFVERDQLALFPTMTNNEPGDARVTVSAQVRGNIAKGHSVSLSAARYLALSSPVARRIYRLLEVVRPQTDGTWRVGLERLADQLPLIQRYPSHLQRVLQPAHEMLVAAGVLRSATFVQEGRTWLVEYVLSPRTA